MNQPHEVLLYNPDWSWQEVAREKRTAKGGRGWTQIAGVGSGKTIFSLKCAKDDFDAAITKAVIAFAPRKSICDGFIEDALSMGLYLDPNWNPNMRKLRQGFHGAVFTYQSASNIAIELNEFMKKNDTTLICDEWHHLFEDENAGWIVPMQAIMKPAKKYILMSGTMFRTYGKIAEIARDENGFALADDRFEYRQGIASDINRGISFPMYEATTRFETSDGSTYEYTFADAKSEKEANIMLNSSLRNKDFIKDMLLGAKRELLTLNSRHPLGLPDNKKKYHKPAVLVVAIDIEHAKTIVEILREMGEDPLLVHSEEKDSHDAIKTFKTSERKWIVSVGMITEGVNIPRIMVGVWLSNITAPSSVVQGIGRAVRRFGPADDMGFWLFPKDVRFEKIAWKFTEDHKFAMKDKEEKEATGQTGEPKTKKAQFDRVVSSMAKLSETIYNGRVIDNDDMELCKVFVRSSGCEMHPAKFYTEVYRHYSPAMKELFKQEIWSKNNRQEVVEVEKPVESPRHEVLGSLCEEIEKLVGKIAFQELSPGEQKLPEATLGSLLGKKKIIINTDLKREFGTRSEIGDPKVLESQIEILKKRLSKNRKQTHDT